MKILDYLPEAPSLVEKMDELNAKLGMQSMLNLSKSAGDTGKSPTFGIDYIVNQYIKNQIGFRKQLIQDLQTIAFSVEEIRGPIGHITGEVFRRGLEFHPVHDHADEKQLITLKKVMKDCNIFDQSLEEVLRQFHLDLNTVDDAFIYLNKEYYATEDGELRSRIIEIRRLNPALVEFDLNEEGLPKKQHFLCPIHRDSGLGQNAEYVEQAEISATAQKPGVCTGNDCSVQTVPAMYRYSNRSKIYYLLDSEVIHLSKFSPTETYGWSPILTIFEKALTLIGMDRNLYRYFFERKMPSAMLLVSTDDPESLRRERENIAAQTKQDPNYIPMVAVSSKTNRGRVDMVRLFHTLQEMDYLPVKEEIRERVAALWGVSPAWQGTPEAFGGLSTQTQGLQVMSRVVESDQRLYHEKVFPLILEAYGITDWTLSLPHPEEKAEATRINFASQRVQIAKQLNDLGFDLVLKQQDSNMDDVDFIVSGEPVPSAQIRGETEVLALTAQEDQMKQQQMQLMEQQLSAEEAGKEGGPPPEAEGGEEAGGEEPVEQSMDVDKAEGKFKDRNLGWKTPDTNDKMPLDERDLDEYAEARARKGEERDWGLVKGGTSTWMEGLYDLGYTSPLVKEITADGNKMWFTDGNKNFVAYLTPFGVSKVEPATFTTARPQRKRVEPSNQLQSNAPSSSGVTTLTDMEEDD
jgi:hypothetical protein